MLKIISNRDMELAKEAELKLKEMEEKYGIRYCPCAFEHNENTKCICKEFREQDYPGSCHCGRYEKIEVDL